MPLTGEKRVLMHLESGIKLFLSHKDFINVLENSSLGFKNLKLEEGIYLAHGGVLTATLLEKVEGQEYVADEKSTIVTDGTTFDTEVVRNGKKIALKAGEKAQKGDICYVLKDGIRIDRNMAFCVTPTETRRKAVKSDRLDEEMARAAMREELQMN